MTEDIKYPLLIDTAMRGMVRDVLRRVSSTGLPGEHHFYISLNTTYPGVFMSEQLRAKYPKEITLVLQHQFWDFKVEEQGFQVTLSFGGVPEKLVIPFAAMTAFADPSVKFGLQFQPVDAPVGEVLPEAISVEMVGIPSDDSAASAEILSLDAFRKK